ncbi:hypothetical protein KKC32_03840 [Patescibacteria group bacterium]|nr:hypothetical protein [Patescibacteria group bacterium]
MKEFGPIFFGSLIIAVFVSGLGIYFFNLAQGKNLADPPQVDLSAYDMAFAKFNEVFQNVSKLDAVPDKPTESAPEVIAENNYGSGAIYFKNSFRMNTAVETDELIRKFLLEFPESENLSIENLQAKNKIEVEIFLKNMEQTVADLQADEDVVSVINVEDGKWQIEFKEPKYENEVFAFLTGRKSVKLACDFPKNEEYVAKLDYSGISGIETFLEKLKADYSDIVFVD